MKICVFGPGNQPGRFGYDFCERARAAGHEVTAFSHLPHQGHVLIDYNDIAGTVEKFEQVITGQDTQLVLYNATCASYPSWDQAFGRDHKIQQDHWYHAVNVHAVLPHALALCAQRHMPKNSAMIFMGSGMARAFDRDHNTNLAGYAGGKAMQTHLMLSLAHHNTNDMIFSSIFPYFGAEVYDSVLNKIFDHATNIDRTSNGKIFEIYN